MPLIAELRRRNVFRVATAYLVSAWLIIQVAETLFSLFGFGETPAQLVVVMLAIGLVPTLVFAWIFRLTPDGFRREVSSAASHVHAPYPTRRLDKAIIVVLALAVSFFAFDNFVLDPQRERSALARRAAELADAREQGRAEALIESFGERSIAVLPFRNNSEDLANEYFSDGISEELLNLLARIPGLRVISRTSAFSFKGRDFRLSQVAEELKVTHILEGTVRKSGNRVRITAQLIEPRSDTLLWSHAWDRTLDDIFAVQEEIAKQVAEHLELTLLSDRPKPHETLPDAYPLYLQARFLGAQGTPEGYAQAIALLEEVLIADPDYAPAWETLAGSFINQASKGLRPAEEGFEKARAAAGKALSIDDRFGPAHARLGLIAMLHDHDLPQAARHYERAVELAPNNARIIGDAAALLKSLGRIEECIALDEFVVSRDPINAVGHFNLGGSYLYSGRYDEAIASLQTALRLSPGRIAAHYHIGIAYLLRGEPDAALKAFAEEPLEVLRLLGQAMAHHAMGERDLSDRHVQELSRRYPKDAAYNIAYVLAFRGQTHEAFEWLDRAIENRDPGLIDIAAEPLFENLWSDPRWLPTLRTLGKHPAQLQAIEFQLPAVGV